MSRSSKHHKESRKRPLRPCYDGGRPSKPVRPIRMRPTNVHRCCSGITYIQFLKVCCSRIALKDGICKFFKRSLFILLFLLNIQILFILCSFFLIAILLIFFCFLYPEYKPNFSEVCCWFHFFCMFFFCFVCLSIKVSLHI